MKSVFFAGTTVIRGAGLSVRDELDVLTSVAALLRTVQGLDTAYLARWADALGLTALYREVSA